VLEDDFAPVVSRKQAYLQLAAFLVLRQSRWDVAMLAANVLDSRASFPFVRRVKDAQTLAGYMVTKQYAPVLLENFREGAALLKNVNSDWHAIDMFMKPLQKRHRWFAFAPRIGIQRPCYSDIEKRDVDYKV
jgi:hypothetical protein